MPIDVRAKAFCNLGPLISGNISDEPLTVGQGLIRCRGQLVLKGLITPSVGSVVTLGYEQNGKVSRIPRVLRVLGSFADPFRNTTTVSIGDKLVFLADKNSAYKESKPNTPEQDYPDNAAPGDSVDLPAPYPDPQDPLNPDTTPTPKLPITRRVWNGVCWADVELPDTPDPEDPQQASKSQLKKQFPQTNGFDFGSEYSSRTVFATEQYANAPLKSFLEVKPTISASFVALKCLAGLGISARNLPLFNSYAEAEFDLTSGYVSVLDQLLSSESLVGYLDETEMLVVRSVVAPVGSGPLITEDDIIDFGPLNYGTPPSQRVVVFTTLDQNKEKPQIPANVAPVANDVRTNLRYRNDRSFTVASAPLAFKGFDPDYRAQSAVASTRTLRVSSVSGGQGCSVTTSGIDNAFIEVTPDPGFAGIASFSFTLTDGQSDSAPANYYFATYIPDPNSPDIPPDFSNPDPQSLDGKIKSAEEQIAEAHAPDADKNNQAEGGVTQDQKDQADQARDANKRDWEYEESQGNEETVLIPYTNANNEDVVYQSSYIPYTNTYTSYDSYDRATQRSTRTDSAMTEMAGNIVKTILELEGDYSDSYVSSYRVERFGYYTSWDRPKTYTTEQSDYGKAYDAYKEREKAAWEEANLKNQEAHKSLPISCPLDFKPPESPSIGDQYVYDGMTFEYAGSTVGWQQLQFQYTPISSSSPSAIYASDLQNTVVSSKEILYSWLEWQEIHQYEPVAKVQASLNVPMDEGFYAYPRQDRIKTDYTYITNDVDWENGKTKTTTERWTILANTARGQQLIAEIGKDIQLKDTFAARTAAYNDLLNIATTFVHAGTDIAIRTDREYGVQQRPSVYSREWVDIYGNEAADPSVFGDFKINEKITRPPNASAELEQFLPPDPATEPNGDDPAEFPLNADAQFRFPELKLTMPYTTAPERGIGQDNTAFYEEAKARQQALAYARAANAVLRGTRFGAALQLPVSVTPTKTLDWLYVKIGGVGAAYRTNGTSWVFNEAGIMCNTDALFWGGVGGTGTPWFPLAQGINTLPPLPTVTSSTPAPANSIPTPEGFDAASPGTIWASLPYLQDPVYPKAITPAALVPAFQERVTLQAVTQLQFITQRYDYSLTVAPQDVVLSVQLQISAARAKIFKPLAGSIAVSGQAANRTYTRRVQAVAGSFASTGYSAGSVRSYGIGTNAGTFALSGQNAIVKYQRSPLAAGLGAFSISGQDALWRKGVIMPAAAGAFSLSGQFAGKLQSLVMPAAAGALSTTGQAAQLTYVAPAFSYVTYTGNATARSITGVGFRPTIVILNNLSSTISASFDSFDIVRGAGTFSQLSDYRGSITDAQTLTSFDSDGFSLGTSSTTNRSTSGTNQYEAYCWKGASSTASNTSGTITTTVAASDATGVSAFTYTGNGTAGATIGHGLSSTPDLVLVRNRVFGSTAADAALNSPFLGGAYQWLMTSNSAAISDTTYIRSVGASTITLGSTGRVNTSGSTYFGFAFKSVVGVSKIGVATGGGTGVLSVNVGFMPKFLLLKTYVGTGNWSVFRPTSGTTGYATFVNINSRTNPSVSTTVQITSSGFSVDAGAAGNVGTSSILYMAYA